MGDMTSSNVVRDILGISSIPTNNTYCMQPMFRIIPGFVSQNGKLHGNDIITSPEVRRTRRIPFLDISILTHPPSFPVIQGDDFIIGDDIRGFSAVDLSQVAEVKDSKQVVDQTIKEMSVRLSTLGYDTEFYTEYHVQSSAPSLVPSSSTSPSAQPSSTPSLSTVPSMSSQPSSSPSSSFQPSYSTRPSSQPSSSAAPSLLPSSAPSLRPSSSLAPSTSSSPTELGSAEYNLTVACDTISTDSTSSSLVVGDVLTVIGRTFLGAAFPDPVNQIPQVLERIQDVQQVLIDLHWGLYEIHQELLKRAQHTIKEDFKASQLPLHSLRFADDKISSEGGDIVVGDSATLYVQIGSISPDFTFDELNNTVTGELNSILRDIMNERQANLTYHIENHLTPSTPLTNSEESAVPFADVPFHLSIGNDMIDLYENKVVAVGDYASLGIVYAEDGISDADLSDYYESVYALRIMPSPGSFFDGFKSLGNDGNFFYQRYSSAKSKEVELLRHGDSFVGRSGENLVYGDYMTAAMYGLRTSSPNGDTTTTYSLDTKVSK